MKQPTQKVLRGMSKVRLELTVSEYNDILGALKFSMQNIPNTAFIRWARLYNTFEEIMKQTKDKK